MGSGRRPSPKSSELGSKLIAEAATWAGTPYRFKARLKGLGADCGTFMVDVAKTIYACAPLPNYTSTYLTDDNDYHVDWVLSFCIETTEDDVEEGDIVLFKYGRKFAHCGFVDADGYVWHCWGRGGLGGVTRSPMTWFKDRGRDRPRRFFRPIWRPEFMING